MNKHTPGPWKVNEEAIVTVPGGIIAWISSPEDYTEPVPETWANANLIAAAPDMYEALLEVSALNGHMTDDGLDKARAAIAKAEGRQ